MSRATELADELDAMAGRITRYTNSPGDSLCAESAEEMRRLYRVNVELEMALTVYITAIATAGGGDKQLFMAALRQADDKARAALTSSTGEPK